MVLRMASIKPTPVRVYDSTIPSGNAYKVHLLLAQLGHRDYETVDLNILATPSETRRPEFLAKNPNGRIPVLELSDGTFLAESNAILCFLAEGTALFPREPVPRARTLQWLFFEQYSHERFIAVLKYWTYWGGLENKSANEVASWREHGQEALDVMEKHLENGDFFVDSGYTIADIALFAYTQSAAALDFNVGKNTNAWLLRVRGKPSFIAIKNDPRGAGA